MKTILEQLYSLLGSHEAVAELLQYSNRQYLNIRQRVERGGTLKPRIELWILANYSLLKKD
jgi:hypothetical protein